jgi:hypothetical protein
LSGAEVDAELMQCRTALRERLAWRARTLAYPYGALNGGVVAHASANVSLWLHDRVSRIADRGAVKQIPRLDMYYFQAPDALENGARGPLPGGWRPSAPAVDSGPDSAGLGAEIDPIGLLEKIRYPELAVMFIPSHVAESSRQILPGYGCTSARTCSCRLPPRWPPLPAWPSCSGTASWDLPEDLADADTALRVAGRRPLA